MKKITYPQPFKLTINGETSDYSLANFTVYLLDSCRVFNDTGKAIRAATRIETKVRESLQTEVPDNGRVIILDDDDWALLSGVCEEPDKGMPFSPARILLPIIDAIKNAETIE